MPKRCAALSRKTNETDIDLKLDLDGTGRYTIASGQAFFDHMLAQLARHGGFDLDLSVRGDLEVDCHHTVEDCGIVLGQAIAAAAQDKRGLRRFGRADVPMDEALARVALDFSGRPFLHFEADFAAERLGSFETETVREFMRALAFNAGLTLHMEVPYGVNTHHKIEALFKALALALAEALRFDPGRAEILPSTKGTL